MEPNTHSPRPDVVAPPTVDARRGGMKVAWIMLVMSVALHVTSLAILFNFPCHSGPVFAAYLAAVALSLLVVPVTLIQQIRSPIGHRRGMQATFLYIGSAVLILFGLVSFMATVMSFDSC